MWQPKWVNELKQQNQELKQQNHYIIQQLRQIMATQAEISAQLDTLTANVADETTVIGGMEKLLDNLAALIQSLKDAATNAQIDPAIVDKITALGAAVSANKTRISADVVKNTPVAPTPTP